MENIQKLGKYVLGEIDSKGLSDNFLEYRFNTMRKRNSYKMFAEFYNINKLSLKQLNLIYNSLDRFNLLGDQQRSRYMRESLRLFELDIKLKTKILK